VRAVILNSQLLVGMPADGSLGELGVYPDPTGCLKGWEDRRPMNPRSRPQWPEVTLGRLHAPYIDRVVGEEAHLDGPSHRAGLVGSFMGA
jgi:hypothetical protein